MNRGATESVTAVADKRMPWVGRFARPQVQWGAGLAVVGPFVTLCGGFVVIALTGMHNEYSLSWGLLHILGFGILQLAWILPASIVAVVVGKRGFAAGLLVGGAALLAANALAWLAGLTIGAR